MARFPLLLLLCGIGFLTSCSRVPEAAPADGAPDDASDQKPVTLVPRPFDPAIGQGIEKAKELPRSSDESQTLEGEKPINLQVVNGREEKIADEILTMPEGEAQSLALTELIRRWSETDLEAALAFRDKLGNGRETRRAYYRGIANELAREQPETLLEAIAGGLWWQDQWKPERAAVLLVADDDLNAAVSHFSNTGKNKQHNDVAYHFSNRLANEQSIDAALAFAESLDRPSSQGYALRAAMNAMAGQDPAAATRYIEGVQDPLLQSHAIQGMIDEIWQTNPGESIAWAMSMQDGELRKGTLAKLAQNWNNDEGKANLQQILDQNSLSPAEKKAIEEVLKAE